MVLKALRDIRQSFNVPSSFSPPFKANVTETYESDGKFIPIKEGLLSLSKDPPKPLVLALKVRKKKEKNFGFNTKLNQGDFGPFEVEFLHDNKATIYYEESHFLFYGELITLADNFRGHFAVKFKTLKGRIYFYSIYPGHFLIFKFLIENLRLK